MNDLKINKEVMTSREIAEVTGKEHKNVLAAIRSMEEAWVKVTGLSFKLSEYTDSTGRNSLCMS
jgi:phage regulator Rha-like protein